MAGDCEVLGQLERVRCLLLSPDAAALQECESLLGRVVDQVRAGAASHPPALARALASITQLLEWARNFYEGVFGAPHDALAQYKPDGALRVHSAAPSFAIEV